VTVNNLIDAHRVLLGAILTQQLRDLEAGVALSNSVAPKLLSGLERDEIKWALSCVEAVPDLLGVPMIGR
jgi:signal-transduction protein with cAMP-binding, CBS, and nucleotidyltransferase domain